VKWCKDGIFKTAFDSFINTEYINKDIKLFIDSTFINNKYRVEDIGDAKLTLSRVTQS
jgi:hypothetical protein